MVEQLSFVSKITAISSSRSVSVHLTLPSGGSVQAFARTFACISPVITVLKILLIVLLSDDMIDNHS